MDCRISRSNFISENTFKGPDGLYYPKLKVTQGYGDIHLAVVNFNNNVNGNVEVIKEQLFVDEFVGEYEASTLYTKIYNTINNFISEYTTTYSYAISGINNNLKNIFNNNSDIKSKVDSSYISNNISNLGIYSQIQISFSNKNYGVVIKQTPNGIDKILPFTIPFTTVNSYEYDYIHNTLSIMLRSSSYFIMKAFIHSAFFKLIWLNENFFSTKQSNIFNYSNTHYTIPTSISSVEFTLIPGVYSKYGLLMGMLHQVSTNVKGDGYDLYLLPSLYPANNKSIIVLLAPSTTSNQYNPYIPNVITYQQLSTSSVTNYADLYSNIIDVITLQYDSNTFNIPVNRTFTTTPTTQGSATFSISGTLPTGLSFNTSTGVISGKSTVVNQTYTVTVTANISSNTYTFDITFNIVAEEYTYPPIYTSQVNSQFEITPNNPPVALMNGTLTFNNVLQSYMIFNTTTGVITGNSNNIIRSVSITINMTEIYLNTIMTYSQNILVKSPKLNVYIISNIIEY